MVRPPPQFRHFRQSAFAGRAKGLAATLRENAAANVMGSASDAVEVGEGRPTPLWTTW
ncbi:hypothetical protein [Neisseria meningitidis]|uniref:hypothetical protein n=1 Tax=Neisseria meningitidis TaxID=487 RepID=UPI002852ECF4|nr:hypothetical protein [Neisseria meningitidis]